jgi:ribosomal protein S18 acetylase RimI-like enzyme
MAENVVIRRATNLDVGFLVEAIVEAEKSGTHLLSYSTIFDLSEDSVHALLSSMLREDLVGQEICISGFLLAETDSSPIAACCAWIEGLDGISSSLLKANLLLHYVDADHMQAAQRHLRKLEALTIPRETGAIQIESVYVKAPARGHGLAALLIQRHFDDLRPRAAKGKAQVILASTNRSARTAYEKLGFKVVAERSSEDPSLSTLIPARQKLMMEKTLEGVRGPW